MNAATRAAIAAALAMQLHGSRPAAFHGHRTLVPRPQGDDPQALERAKAKRAEKLLRRRQRWLESGGRDG